MRAKVPAMVLLGAILSVSPAWALFQLSAEPRRGGQAIRFTANTGAGTESSMGMFTNEELSVTVSTDQARPYQILQTLYQPLTNEFGRTLPPDAFIVFSPSSPAGTLRTQLETPVTLGQRQIYTSNDAGDSTEFLLLYNVRVPEGQPGGIYRTQLTLTLEPVQEQAGISPQIVTLEVRVEIASSFRVVVQGQGGSRSLDLGTIRQDAERSVQDKELNVAIESNASGRYQVSMLWAEPLMSSTGQALDPSALLVAAGGGKNGSLDLPAAHTALDSSNRIIYRSDQWGTQDEFVLSFLLSPEIRLKAGTYQGALVLQTDSSGSVSPPAPVTIPVRFTVETVFSLQTVVEGGGSLSFGSFRGEGGEVERSVQLKVLSNMDSPYQISQILSRKMSNDQGAPVPAEAFRVRTENARTGRTTLPEFQPVKDGETILFVSDPDGSPEDVVVRYSLNMPSGAPAGQYSTEISYSITTL